MSDRNLPIDHQPPSLGQLRKATVVAALVGSMLLVTTILPAEYGIDPIGVGRVLGLTEMGELKERASAPAQRQEWRFTLIGAAHAQARRRETMRQR